MKSFAKGTTVAVAKSRMEIEKLLTRYGATRFASGWGDGVAILQFEAHGRHIKFTLPIPSPDDPRFAKDKRGVRSEAQRKADAEAEERRRWRALALVIKAKLEAVESGICNFEAEFLANVVVPGGQTFGAWAAPRLAEAYAKGAAMPPMLGAGS